MSRKLKLLMLSLVLSIVGLHAQLSQTINVTSPGSLAALLGDNKTKVTDLTLTGSINAQDFQTIKEMVALKDLDMAAVSVPSNALPYGSFAGKNWDSLKLPNTLKQIDDRAFNGTVLST